MKKLFIFLSVLSVIIIVSPFVLFRPMKIYGMSMEPNYHNGDYYLVGRFAFIFRSPQRSEVVIYSISRESGEYEALGRVVGLPGEKVKIENGKVYINGQELQERYLSTEEITTAKVSGKDDLLKEGVEVVIPSDNYFIMGDNRDRSSDSRTLGFVKKDKISGNFILKYWPLSDNK